MTSPVKPDQTGRMMANALRRGEKALAPVRPNAGIEAEYRRRLRDLVDDMAKSYARFLKAQYRKTPPRMAQDATPAQELKWELGRLGKRWEARLDDAAPKLARWFAQSAARRSERALKTILRDSGASVRFKVTPMMRDVMDASVQESVSLIKSIPQQFHTQVEGLVMRSVARGRDLEQLVADLQKQFGVTRRRAEFIALDQNNKVTSAVMAARQIDLGIECGIWRHSHAGKVPRPTHVANDGKRFDLKKGWFDPDPKVRRRIWPAELINCRCGWSPVVKGFS